MTERGKIKRQYNGYAILRKHIQNYVSSFVKCGVTTQLWMTVWYKLEGNSFHTILRYWHCNCLGLRKTTKNLLRTEGILVEVQNGHLLNMSQILLLEPTCSITEMILLKNNYQETKWGDVHVHTHTHTHTHICSHAHTRQEWVATDTRNVL
jgi:hypothetical protein